MASTDVTSGINGWQHEIIEYTGDGLAGHLITTSFPLDTGVVAIWIMRAGADAVFKHSAMTDTAVNGATTLDTDAITAFTSTGFTVGNDAKTNSSGNQHIAIVLRDSTADNTYMRVGEYLGDGADDKAITVGIQPTHVWTFRAAWLYRSTDFSGDACVDLTANSLSSNGIQSFSADGFVIGSSTRVNNAGSTYYYLAFDFSDERFARFVFRSFKETGTAAADDRIEFTQAVGFFFSPYVAFVKRFSSATECNWRAYNIQTGDDSTGLSGTNNTSGGIDALVLSTLSADGYIDVGEDLLPDTVDAYGYAFTAGYTYASATLIRANPNQAIIGTVKNLAIIGTGFPTNPLFPFDINFVTGGRVVTDGGFTQYQGGLVVASTDHERFSTVTLANARLVPSTTRRKLGWVDAVMTYQVNSVGGIASIYALNFFKFILRPEVPIIPPVAPGSPPGVPPGFPGLTPGAPGFPGFPVGGLPTRPFNRPRGLGSVKVEQVISFGYQKGDPPALAEKVFDVRDLPFDTSTWQTKIEEILEDLDAGPVRIVAIGSRDGNFRSVGIANSIAKELYALSDHRDKAIPMSAVENGSGKVNPVLLKALKKMRGN